MRRPTDLLDAIIVGAGPAGLTAAIYLARFERRFVVLHDARNRVRWIPRSHNHPGFPRGVRGPVLLARMRRQAEGFGAEVREGKVTSVQRRRDGAFTVAGDGFELAARTVLLATGVHDNHPPLPGVATAIRRAVVRICPICDAYEARGLRIGVVGDAGLGAREAAFLRRYSEAVTLLHVGATEALTPADRRLVEHCGATLVECALADIRLEADGARVKRPVGPELVFDTLYAAMGAPPRNELAEEAGVATNEGGYLVAGQAHQETAVPGLYAAGDVVRGLNQISVAQAEAAIAATAMHNFLRDQGL
jgi:thioredoxin reductase (NADPH)